MAHEDQTPKPPRPSKTFDPSIIGGLRKASDWPDLANAANEVANPEVYWMWENCHVRSLISPQRSTTSSSASCGGWLALRPELAEQPRRAAPSAFDSVPRRRTPLRCAGRSHSRESVAALFTGAVGAPIIGSRWPGSMRAALAPVADHVVGGPANGARTIVMVRSSRSPGLVSISAKCRLWRATRSHSAAPSSGWRISRFRRPVGAQRQPQGKCQDKGKHGAPTLRAGLATSAAERGRAGDHEQPGPARCR